MDLAFQDIRQHLGRFIATIIGVGLLFAVVLSFNGIYRGFLLEGLSFIKTTNPDLWVVERYRGGPINEQSILPEFYHYSVAAHGRRRPGQPAHLFSRGKGNPGSKPALRHRRLRCLRWSGRAPGYRGRSRHRPGSL